MTEMWQARFMAERGSRVLYAADEFYLLADREVPEDWDYEDYPQIENGVGIIRKFYNDFTYCAADLPAPINSPSKYVVVTGIDGAKALNGAIKELQNNGNNIDVLAVKNTFFGATVTVTGLLTSGDIITALNNYPSGDAVFLIPDILLKFHSDLLLDGKRVDDIRRETHRNIKVIETSAYDLIEAISKTGDNDETHCCISGQA